MKLSAEAFGILKFPGLDASGGIVGGSVTLPDLDATLIVQPQQVVRLAVDVQYVSDKSGPYSGNWFTQGTLDINRLPEFTGDLIREAGSDFCTIKTLPLTIGNYAKVTVNVKGQITSGSGLNELDVPNLSWNTVSLNRPITLSGYGIGDALSIDGGTLTGNFSVAVCTELDHIANKDMTDTLPTEGYLKPGSIITKATDQQVPYFLKCNGAEPLINDYVLLYEAIGDTFTVKLAYGYGVPHLLQHQFNATTTSTWSWTSDTNFPITLNRAKSIVTKERVYILGGAQYTNATSSLNRVYTATIDPLTGDIGAWSLVSYLPIALDSFEVVVNANRLFIIGGSNLGTDRTTIYSTDINPDGTLNVWQVIGDLPFPLSGMSVLITRNMLTVIGGKSGTTIKSTVIQAQIKPDGTLGIWEYCPDLPGPRARAAVFCTGNYVYLVAGQNDRAVAINTTLRSTIQDDGSLTAWTVMTSVNLPDNSQDSSVFCTSTKVHLVGGGTEKASATRNRIYSASINSDGTIGGWTFTSYPEQVRCACLFLTSTRLFVLGGYRSNTSLRSVRYTNFLGGLNDYSPTYSAEKKATDRGYFRLPDIVSSLQGTNSYVKT